MKRIKVKDPVLFGHLMFQSGALTIILCLAYVKRDPEYLICAIWPVCSIILQRLFWGNGLDN